MKQIVIKTRHRINPVYDSGWFIGLFYFFSSTIVCKNCF